MKFSSWVNQKIQPRRSMLNLKCLVMEKLLWHNQLCCGYGREGKVPWLKRVCSDDLTLWNIVSVILSTPSDILQSKKWEHTATVCLRFCHLIREKKMHEFHPINVSASDVNFRTTRNSPHPADLAGLCFQVSMGAKIILKESHTGPWILTSLYSKISKLTHGGRDYFEWRF